MRLGGIASGPPVPRVLLPPPPPARHTRDLRDKIAVEIRITAGNNEANGSIAMNCLILRDRHFADREVLEPQYAGSFVNVVGSHACASEPKSRLRKRPRSRSMNSADAREQAASAGSLDASLHGSHFARNVTGDLEYADGIWAGRYTC